MKRAIGDPEVLRKIYLALRATNAQNRQPLISAKLTRDTRFQQLGTDRLVYSFDKTDRPIERPSDGDSAKILTVVLGLDPVKEAEFLFPRTIAMAMIRGDQSFSLIINFEDGDSMERFKQLVSSGRIIDFTVSR
jgi:hypothetical protein